MICSLYFLPFNRTDMCQAWRHTFVCGHQSGEKWYSPESAEDCPDAVQANRRHRRHGTLLRCSPLGTASVSVQGVCPKDECYAQEYLIPYGWWCHHCGKTNRAGKKHCTNPQAGFDFTPCRHKPCRQCTIPDTAGQ